MSSDKEENREHLINLLSLIDDRNEPEGWEHISSLTIGGLLSVGFSQIHPLLLVVSHQGRGLISCETGEKVARDYEEYVGLSDNGLFCEGIGPIEKETIKLCSENGGGLPQSNTAGESLELVSPNWPEYDIIFCSNYNSALVEGNQTSCARLYTDYVKAFGFSWCGNYIVAASGSGLKLWKRREKL